MQVFGQCEIFCDFPFVILLKLSGGKQNGNAICVRESERTRQSKRMKHSRQNKRPMNDDGSRRRSLVNWAMNTNHQFRSVDGGSAKWDRFLVCLSTITADNFTVIIFEMFLWSRIRDQLIKPYHRQ